MVARMPLAALATALLLLACAVAPARAIYQDQAGQYEWLQQHVGRVSLAELSAAPRPRLFVASADGAVAALSVKDGSLLWRRVLSDGDAATRLVPGSDRLLTLTDGGRQLTAWDAATGAAFWAVEVPGAGQLSGPEAADMALYPQAPGTTPKKTARDMVVVAAKGVAKGYNVTDGIELWSTPVPRFQGAAALRLAKAEAAGTWGIALQPGASLLAVDHMGPSGDLAPPMSLSASGVQLSASQLLLTGSSVAALSADGTQLCAAEVQLGMGDARLSCTPLAALLPSGASAGGARLLRGSCSTHFALQTDGGAAVVQVSANGVPSLVTFVPGAAASGCFLGPSPALAPQVALSTPTGGGLKVQTVSAADGSVLEEAMVEGLAPTRLTGPTPVAAVFAARLSRGGDKAVSQLVVWDDDSLALVRGSSQQWVRHEELGSIKDLLFTDLPAPTPENEAHWLASQPGRGEALVAQLLALKVQANGLSSTWKLASPEEEARLERYRTVTSDKLRPTRDPDGFRKQLVVLTSRGKVLALHNGDGRVLWSLDFGPGEGTAKLAAPSKLALWRVPHDVQHDVEVVALAVGPLATQATVINAHTGALVTTHLVFAASPDVLPLPVPVHDGTADQHAYVLAPAGTGAAAKMLPDTPAANAAFQAARPAFSFWRVDREAGVVRGLGFTETGVVEERWSAQLAPPVPEGSSAPRQHILSVASHTPGEAVASPARVMGSGELKFKYLNPNALLVSVGEPAGSWGVAWAEGEAVAAPRLTVSLLDAVTGRVLFSQAHEDASGPVHAVLSENTATYHFWSTEAHRWQMASFELFDASPTTLQVTDLAFSETNSTSSSWDAPPLEAASQSFLCRLPVAGLAVTRSARGNTAKQIMLLTPAGQVYMLDRRFLDPRRPIVMPGQKPTPQQAAEGLPPYQPELPMGGPMFATLDHRVARLSGVAVEAAVLESTQLMAAHGLDLFYTRLTPSKSFDMVPDDFPYALLVLIVGGMITATVVLKMMTNRTAVKAKWQ